MCRGGRMGPHAAMRVLIAAGGTAGHVVPALAVADALREHGAEVEFVGGERAEKALVPAAGYPLRTLGAVRGLDRRNPLRAAVAAVKALGAVVRSLRLVREARPAAVPRAGGGGGRPGGGGGPGGGGPPRRARGAAPPP